MRYITSVLKTEQASINRTTEKMELQTNKLMRRLIYRNILPYINKIQQPSINKDDSAIIKLLKSGVLTYSKKDNAFDLSRLNGEQFIAFKTYFPSASDGMLYIGLEALPSDMQNVINEIYATNEKYGKPIIDFLTKAGIALATVDVLFSLPEAEKIIEYSKPVEKIAQKVDITAEKIVAKTEKVTPQPAIEEIAPTATPVQLTPQPKAIQKDYSKMYAEYTNDLKIRIKGLTDDQIAELRAEITEMILTGKSSKDFIKKLETQYSMSKSRAKLIARQETQNALTTYENKKVAPFTDGYEWVHPLPNRPTSRPDHVHFHKASKAGMVFSASNPAINAKGEITEPGKEINCHCFKRHVLREM